MRYFPKWSLKLQKCDKHTSVCGLTFPKWYTFSWRTIKIDGQLKFTCVYQKAVEGENNDWSSQSLKQINAKSMLFKPRAHFLIQKWSSDATSSSSYTNQRGVNLGIRFEDTYIYFCFLFAIQLLMMGVVLNISWKLQLIVSMLYF